MEEKAAGKLTESAERPGSLGDSTEEYVPARWTRKKIALTAAIGVVAAALSIGCAAALYLHTLDLALTGGMDAAQQDDLARGAPAAEAQGDRSRGDRRGSRRTRFFRLLRGHSRLRRASERDYRPLGCHHDRAHRHRDGHSSPRFGAPRHDGGNRGPRHPEDQRRSGFRRPGRRRSGAVSLRRVPITHYVELRFEQLVELVDRLGGVTVDVPEGFTSDTSGITLAAGTQTLSGEEALAFARERHAVSSGDFSRAAAQRAIISAIADEVLASPPTELPSLVGSLASCVTTDYTAAELADTALALKDTGVTVYSAACPSYSFGEGGISYVGTMYDEWRAMMQRVDAGLDPADESAEIPEPQASDEDLGAATNARSPRDYSGHVDQASFKDN